MEENTFTGGAVPLMASKTENGKCITCPRDCATDRKLQLDSCSVKPIRSNVQHLAPSMDVKNERVLVGEISQGHRLRALMNDGCRM